MIVIYNFRYLIAIFEVTVGATDCFSEVVDLLAGKVILSEYHHDTKEIALGMIRYGLDRL